MSLSKNSLIEFLEALDEEFSRKVIIVAAGGTAMTLLNGKPSTIDVDFTIPKEFYEDFKLALKNIPHGFKVDVWPEGQVFSQMLPSDYLEMSILIQTTLKQIELRTLHPLDIVVTKIGRLIGRDMGDIEICIRNFDLKAEQIRERASKIGYAGNDKVYEINLNTVIQRFFGSKGEI
jgi:uncharacterized nucleotidyltransferase DUF6036